MKIIDMKIVVVGNPWKNWIFVKIFTDEGIEGLGECTGGLMTAPNEGSLKELKSRIIGRDPTRVNELIDFVRKPFFFHEEEMLYQALKWHAGILLERHAAGRFISCLVEK